MKRYIPADKLIAEIERLHKAHSGKYGCDEVGLNLEYLEDFIDSLQQEQQELDLEKEVNECWDYVFSAIGWDENSLMTMNHKEFLAFARHFYELGLNARKEK